MAEQRAYVRTYKYCSCVSQKKMTKLEEIIVGTAGGMYVCLLVSKYSKTLSDRPKGHSQTFVIRVRAVG